MAMRDFDERLTPAARQTLDEIVDDYRKEILVAAATNASRATGDVREISVHDIVRGISESSSPFKFRSGSLLDRLLLAYTGLGVATATVGLALYAFQNISKNVALEDRIPLIAALTGASLAMFSVALLVLKRLQTTRKEWFYRTDPGETLGSYLLTWRDIEVALRTLASSTLGETVAQEPISFLVKRLEKQRTLTPDVANDLQMLLATRNRLAHSTSSPEREEILTYLRQARRVLGQIQDSSSAATNLRN